ncbi:MAG: alpha-ribazole phosphatase CobZ [archaeon]
MVGVSDRYFKSVTENNSDSKQAYGDPKMETKFDDLPLLNYLEDHGVTLKDLLDTALEMHIPHPGIETRDQAAELFKAGFYEALTDVNVAVLEVACFRAEEDGQNGLIPLLPKEQFQGRPGLIVDEYLGMTIANYIAGGRAIFEFIRYDQAKPGILRKLGPIANDAIGGLIAGVSSRVYSGALEKQKLLESEKK